MKRLGRLAAWSFAVLGALVLLTDWIEWPWWVGLMLTSPLGLVVLLNAADDLGWIGDGEGSFDGRDA